MDLEWNKTEEKLPTTGKLLLMRVRFNGDVQVLTGLMEKEWAGAKWVMYKQSMKRKDFYSPYAEINGTPEEWAYAKGIKKFY